MPGLNTSIIHWYRGICYTHSWEVVLVCTLYMVKGLSMVVTVDMNSSEPYSNNTQYTRLVVESLSYNMRFN